MKTNSIIRLFIWINITALSACGGLKMGLDDKTGEIVDCAVNDNCDDSNDGSGQGNGDSDENDSSDDGGTPGGQGEGTNDGGDNDTAGGVIVVEDYERVHGAAFLGTWQALDYDYDYYDVGDPCEYNFPATIRGYSHGDVIDFETQGGGLAFTADIYPDETFDFDVRFQNSVGQPTIRVTCTCDIEKGYGDYYPDEIHCGCESTDADGLCLQYWEKL